MTPQSQPNTKTIVNIDFICSGKSINNTKIDPFFVSKFNTHEFDAPRLSLRKIKYLTMSNAISNIMNDPNYVSAVLKGNNSKISS